jgi:hypothetical protein
MNKLLFASLLFAAACSSSSGALQGTRSDGVAVTCDATDADGMYECTPDDGDDVCEGYAQGGTALVLWPPNHKLVTITLEECAAVVDDCDGDGGDGSGSGDDGGEAGLTLNGSLPLDTVITSISADEAVDANGDGSTKSYDMRLVDDHTVEVRSERQGGGDGRVYRVQYENSLGVGSCEIHVPHDQGPFGGAVDSGEVVRIDG